MKRLWAIWDFFQSKIVEYFCRYVLLAVITLSFVEVIRRYVFGESFIWAEETEIYFNLMAVILYFGFAERKKAHIRLDIVVETIKKRRKRWGEIIDIAAHCVTLAFCALFVWFGIDFVQAGIDFGRRTENAGMLLWPFYVLLLVGFGFLGIETARAIVKQIADLKGGKD